MVKKALTGPSGPGKALPGKSEPAPYAARNQRGRSFQVNPPKDDTRNSGLDKDYAKVQSWVQGKRGSYR